MATRNDRTITLAGDFNQSVEITNSLMNGEACSASDYGHAEGYMSKSEGKYSYAGGYSAYAKHNNSFVWSGKSDGSNFESNGNGTFNIYTNSNISDPLTMVYVDGETLVDRISDSFNAVYLNSNILNTDNEWKKKNTFSGANNGGIILDGVSFQGDSNSHLTMDGDSIFNGYLKAKTIYFSSEDEGVGGIEQVATTQYVKNLFSASLNQLSKCYVKYDGESQIGSSSRPVYVNSTGNVTQLNSDVALIGSDGIGNEKKPVYVESGYIKETVENVGSSVKPMYMSSGVFTELDGNVCNDQISLMYINSGTFTKSTSSVGSKLRPVYLENGVLKPIGSSTIDYDNSVGGKRTPIYINNKGEFETCDTYSGGGGTSGVKSVNLTGNEIETNKFLTTVSKDYDQVTGIVTLNFGKTRPSMNNIDGLLDEEIGGRTVVGKLSWSSGVCASMRSSCAEYSENISSLHTNIPLTYSRRIQFSSAKNNVQTSGNVIQNVMFSDDLGDGQSSAKITVYKTNVLDGVVDPLGTGNFVKSITVENTKVRPSLSYAIDTVQSSNGGTFVSSLSYDGMGKLTVKYDTPPSGGSSTTASLTNSNVALTLDSKTNTYSGTVGKGLLWVVLSAPSWNNKHKINIKLANGDPFVFNMSKEDTISFTYYSSKSQSISIYPSSDNINNAYNAVVGLISVTNT